ncbi:respiratory nitrate reductase subunit gamma [Tessaracoccus sp. OH4464_COT-324]|uniref:respiratory nitrate reductase subunit gamma n=1 Tax=Tessaracoccus sp. OH4464_COT-324 TaxID=2491059 RepID=UPI000F6398AD|nr:respiratory nitrate reductase subunit gamma [Tessaracoccus sp. OH4464_COT-324]RRD46628.1 respiratory nitrate reductase subunit gamma [Tessaracoccus sp. OH4464_COT-324]
MEFLLWSVLPYVVAIVLVGGLIWRYRYDQFGWTTRSSQLYESKLLRFGSPIFHFALLAVLMGHLVGLLIPKAFTDWVGIDQHSYHSVALYGGGLAGVALVVGLVLLLWRRATNPSVRRATTLSDRVMYVVLSTAIGLGLFATLTGDKTPTGEEHNYRETVSVWFRSLFGFQPDTEAMAAATWQFQAHVVIGLLLFAILPFTRLVHAFSAPLHYLFRPYIVYRSRDTTPAVSATTSGRGWDPVGLRDNQRI